MYTRKDGPRPAVIGTCSLSPIRSGSKATGRGINDPNQLLANGLATVEAIAQRAHENGWYLDMVVLPEGFAQVAGRSPQETAQELDGEIVTAFASKARAYSTYIIPCHLRVCSHPTDPINPV